MKYITIINYLVSFRDLCLLQLFALDRRDLGDVVI